MNRHIANRKIAHSAFLRIRSRKTVVLNRSRAKSAFQFCPRQMLQHCADILHPMRIALPLLRLSQHISHQRPQATRCIQTNPERLASKKLMHTPYPESLHCIKIKGTLCCQRIKESDILAHIAHAAATSAATFCGQNAGNAMTSQNSLHRPATQSKHLSTAFGEQRIRIQRQSLFCVLSHNQRNAQRAFSAKPTICIEFLQSLHQVHFYAAFCRTVKAAAANGSKICSAKNRTTGTATPSPAK